MEKVMNDILSKEETSTLLALCDELAVTGDVSDIARLKEENKRLRGMLGTFEGELNYVQMMLKEYTVNSNYAKDRIKAIMRRNEGFLPIYQVEKI